MVPISLYHSVMRTRFLRGRQLAAVFRPARVVGDTGSRAPKIWTAIPRSPGRAIARLEALDAGGAINVELFCRRRLCSLQMAITVYPSMRNDGYSNIWIDGNLPIYLHVFPKRRKSRFSPFHIFDCMNIRKCKIQNAEDGSRRLGRLPQAVAAEFYERHAEAVQFGTRRDAGHAT
jgi:hypothetical protein